MSERTLLRFGSQIVRAGSKIDIERTIRLVKQRFDRSNTSSHPVLHANG